MKCWKCDVVKPIHDNGFCFECYEKFVEEEQTEYKIGQQVVCPNHGGSFDCNPFCVVCEGEQEYTYTGELPCWKCHTWIADDVWREELGMCLECSNKYFDNGN